MLRRWVSCVKELTNLPSPSLLPSKAQPCQPEFGPARIRASPRSGRWSLAAASPRSGRKRKAHGASRGYRHRVTSASPRSGRKIQVRSGHFSVANSVVLGTERTRCRPSALPTDTQRPGPDSFARFAGFILLSSCFPRLAPWALIFRPLRGLARIRARAPPPFRRSGTHQRRPWAGHKSTPSLAGTRWFPSGAKG